MEIVLIGEMMVEGQSLMITHARHDVSSAFNIFLSNQKTCVKLKQTKLETPKIPYQI